MEGKWHPWRYSDLLGCHVFQSAPAADKKNQWGRSGRFVLLTPSPLFSLCLGFIWAAGGGLHAGAVDGHLWSSRSFVQTVCVAGTLMCGHLNSVAFSYHSSAGPCDAPRLSLFPPPSLFSQISVSQANNKSERGWHLQQSGEEKLRCDHWVTGSITISAWSSPLSSRE